MKTELYNSEVIELAKRIFERMAVSENIDNAIVNDIAEMSINNAATLISILDERGFYDNNVVKNLIGNEKEIYLLLTKEITYEEFGPRIVNSITYAIEETRDGLRDAIIADFIRLGRKNIKVLRNLGKKNLKVIDEFLKENGLNWNIDLTKYGL